MTPSQEFSTLVTVSLPSHTLHFMGCVSLMCVAKQGTQRSHSWVAQFFSLHKQACGCRRALPGWKYTIMLQLVQACVFCPLKMTHSRWKLGLLWRSLDFSDRDQTNWMKFRKTRPGGNNLAGFGRGRLWSPTPLADADSALRVSQAWKRSAESHESLPPPTRQWLRRYYAVRSKLHMNRKAKPSSVPFNVTNMHMHAGDYGDRK